MFTSPIGQYNWTLVQDRQGARYAAGFLKGVYPVQFGKLPVERA